MIANLPKAHSVTQRRSNTTVKKNSDSISFSKNVAVITVVHFEEVSCKSGVTKGHPTRGRFYVFLYVFKKLEYIV